jgi:lysozyme
MNYRDLIKEHEGFREMVYLDTEGVPTVGWGHAFFESPAPAVGNVFSFEQCEELFEEDIHLVEREYYRIVEPIQKIEGLDFVRRGVLKNMLFNLGLPKLSKFTKMWRAIRLKDWEKAAEEMLDSKWARQVGRRAIQLSEMMRKGWS